jgi:hypothetical protein
MRKHRFVYGFGIGLLLGALCAAQAQVLGSQESQLTMELQGHVPPISDALAGFLAAAREAAAKASSPDLAATILTAPLVGFNHADIGEGEGDGSNDPVPFSFTFPPFSAIASAILTLTLTPTNAAITTDALMVIDKPQGLNLFDAGGSYVVYGNDLLRELPAGQTTTVRFNLHDMAAYRFVRVNGTIMVELLDRVDLTPFLLDGGLDVVYQDDAILHGATLTITGTPSPARPPLRLP